MRLLLTKTLDPTQYSVLTADILADTIEVISTKSIVFNLENLGSKALIFTSLNAVKSFFSNSISTQLNNNNKIYCVGTQSENLLNKKGFKVIKTEKNADDLSAFIIKFAHQESFLHFCGNIALETIGNNLTEHHIPYQKIISYETELLFPSIDKDYDSIAFFSPSGVKSFVKHNNLDTAKIFSIGETTTNEIKKWTNNPVMTSPKNTTDDLLKLICDNASAKH